MYYLTERYNHLVNADMLIRHTDVWNQSKENSPPLDVIQSMFSSSQIISDFWLVERCDRVNARLEKQLKQILVVDGGYGNLAYYLHEHFNDVSVINMDTSNRCRNYVDQVYSDIPNIHTVMADKYSFDYSTIKYDLIVNTSCETLSDLRKWVDILPAGQLVALQFGNDSNIQDWDNDVEPSLAELRSHANLSQTEEVGQQEFPTYTKYMVIGRK